MISFLKNLFGKKKEVDSTEKTEHEKMYDLVETIREDKTEEIHDIHNRLDDMEEHINFVTKNITSLQTQLTQIIEKDRNNETANIIPQLKNDISDLEFSLEHTKKDLLSRFSVLGNVSINNQKEIQEIKREILNNSFNKKTPRRKKELIEVKLN